MSYYLLVAGCVCFALKAVNVKVGSLDLYSAGCACVVGSFVV